MMVPAISPKSSRVAENYTSRDAGLCAQGPRCHFQLRLVLSWVVGSLQSRMSRNGVSVRSTVSMCSCRRHLQAYCRLPLKADVGVLLRMLNISNSQIFNCSKSTISMSPTSASICPTTPSQHPEPADVETIKSKQISRIVNAPRPHPTLPHPAPAKKLENTTCVSNDRGGQCDQNAYRIIKIGAIFGYFRALQSLEVF